MKFLEPLKDSRLIEVNSAQEHGEEGKSVLQGWGFQPPLTSDARRSGREGATGKSGGNPILVALTTEPEYQAQVRVANVTKGEPGDTDRPDTIFMRGKPRWH